MFRWKKGEKPMYKLKVGVPVHAVQFTGINGMEIFTMIPHAKWLSMTPNESIKVFYKSRVRSHSFDEIELKTHDWLVVDEAGPIVVGDEDFLLRYERDVDVDTTPA